MVVKEVFVNYQNFNPIGYLQHASIHVKHNCYSSQEKVFVKVPYLNKFNRSRGWSRSRSRNSDLRLRGVGAGVKRNNLGAATLDREVWFGLIYGEDDPFGCVKGTRGRVADGG
jgi:hypothetical protein